MTKGFLPISIVKEDRLEYYNALDKYAAQGELKEFADMIAALEEKELDWYLAHKNLLGGYWQYCVSV